MQKPKALPLNKVYHGRAAVPLTLSCHKTLAFEHATVFSIKI